MDDPRTWPLMKDLTQTENGSNYRKSRIPPARLAYEQSIMADLVTLKPMIQADSKFIYRNHKAIKSLFIDYPFNFDSNGKLRKYPHLPEDDLAEWLKWSPKPIAKSWPGPTPVPADLTPEDPLETASTHPPQVKEEPEVDPDTPVSPESAFQQIMKSLSDPKDKQSATIAQLEHELSETKNELSQQKKEAQDAVEKLNTVTNDFHTKAKEHTKKSQEIYNNMQADFTRQLKKAEAHQVQLQKDLFDLKVVNTKLLDEENARTMTAKKETKAAMEKLVNVEEELEERTWELEKSKAELVKANEKIVAIWTEIQKGKYGVKGKRGVGDADGGGVEKKVKMATSPVERMRHES